MKNPFKKNKGTGQNNGFPPGPLTIGQPFSLSGGVSPTSNNHDSHPANNSAHHDDRHSHQAGTTVQPSHSSQPTSSSGYARGNVATGGAGSSHSSHPSHSGTSSASGGSTGYNPGAEAGAKAAHGNGMANQNHTPAAGSVGDAHPPHSSEDIDLAWAKDAHGRGEQGQTSAFKSGQHSSSSASASGSHSSSPEVVAKVNHTGGISSPSNATAGVTHAPRTEDTYTHHKTDSMIKQTKDVSFNGMSGLTEDEFADGTVTYHDKSGAIVARSVNGEMVPVKPGNGLGDSYHADSSKSVSIPVKVADSSPTASSSGGASASNAPTHYPAAYEGGAKPVSVEHLKNGATLTTTATGAEIETTAAGHSYTVKRAPGLTSADPTQNSATSAGMPSMGPNGEAPRGVMAAMEKTDPDMATDFATTTTTSSDISRRGEDALSPSTTPAYMDRQYAAPSGEVASGAMDENASALPAASTSPTPPPPGATWNDNTENWQGSAANDRVTDVSSSGGYNPPASHGGTWNDNTESWQGGSDSKSATPHHVTNATWNDNTESWQGGGGPNPNNSVTDVSSGHGYSAALPAQAQPAEEQGLPKTGITLPPTSLSTNPVPGLSSLNLSSAADPTASAGHVRPGNQL